MNVLACIYTSTREQAADPESNQDYQLPNLQGANESVNDWGRMPMNRSNYLNNSNFMEVCIHPTDAGGIAISPNNGAFLLDMSQPVTSFVLVVYAVQGKKKCGVFQVNIITRDFFACDSMTSLASSLQAMSYLEFMSDYAAYLDSKDPEKKNEEIDGLRNHAAMEPFKQTSCQNQQTQINRLKYF